MLVSKLEGKRFFFFFFKMIHASSSFRGGERVNEGGYVILFIRFSFFFFPIFFGWFGRSPLLLLFAWHRKVREGFTKSTITDIPQHLSSSPRLSSKENELYTHAHTHTHTRDIKRISLPDVDDFLMCCKIITLNGIAKVLLGSRFLFYSKYCIYNEKTERLGWARFRSLFIEKLLIKICL